MPRIAEGVGIEFHQMLTEDTFEFRTEGHVQLISPAEFKPVDLREVEPFSESLSRLGRWPYMGYSGKIAVTGSLENPRITGLNFSSTLVSMMPLLKPNPDLEKSYQELMDAAETDEAELPHLAAVVRAEAHKPHELFVIDSVLGDAFYGEIDPGTDIIAITALPANKIVTESEWWGMVTLRSQFDTATIGAIAAGALARAIEL